MNKSSRERFIAVCEEDCPRLCACDGLFYLQKQIEKLDELVKSRFIEMFGDTYLNNMKWPEKRLDSMASIVSGITKGRRINETDLSEVSYMSVANVKDGYIDYSEVMTIMATNAEIERYRLYPYDVLMTED